MSKVICLEINSILVVSLFRVVRWYIVAGFMVSLVVVICIVCDFVLVVSTLFILGFWEVIKLFWGGADILDFIFRLIVM